MIRSLLTILVIAWIRIAAAQPESVPPSPAPGVTEAAKVLYDAGSKHYELGDYRAAVVSFSKAYSVLPDPLFLFNIAQAYRKLDDCENARTYYQAYLRDEPTADNRAQVERLIATMDDCVTSKSVVVPQSTPEPSRLRLAGIITTAAGATLAATGVYFSLDARNQARTVEQQCGTGCSTADVSAADRRGLAAERNAIVLYAVGGAAFAAGVVMIIWGSMSPRLHSTVMPTPGGGAVTVTF